MKLGWIAVLVVYALLVGACTSCSENSTATPDAGDTSSSDGDTDTDSDSDTDGDTDTDTSTDSVPYTLDGGVWEWEDLPDSGDCGTGCRQLTFTEQVRMLEWDVWDNILVFTDEDIKVHVVKVDELKHLRIPDLHPEYTSTEYPTQGSHGFPTVYQNSVYYSYGVGAGSIPFTEVVSVDLENKTQTILFHGETPLSPYDLHPPLELDVYGDRLAMRGGCGDLTEYSLCLYSLDQNPVSSEMMIEGYYGGYNSIWGDVLIWSFSFGADANDIRGYDFSTQQFLEITDDNDDVFQTYARIQGNRIVYQDLRHGDSDPMGNWNHCVIFMYDLTTQTAMQITSENWISAYPDVYGDIVVWADYRNCSDPNNKNSIANVEIWGYKISTGTTFQITNLPGRSKTTPRIWGDKVFVHMYKQTSGNAIYMFDLPAAAL